MKRIPKSPTPLDRQVASLITRLGMSGPLDHMQAHTVERHVNDLTIVTVRLIADEQFDAQPTERECGRNQEGTLLCRPRNGCDDCPLRDLEVPVR